MQQNINKGSMTPVNSTKKRKYKDSDHILCEEISAHDISKKESISLVSSNGTSCLVTLTLIATHTPPNIWRLSI